LHLYASFGTLLENECPGSAILIVAFVAPERGVAIAVIVAALLILFPSVMAIPLVRREASIDDRELATLNSLGK
jgi:hypothetical protein